jgi:hypothetical protein
VRRAAGRRGGRPHRCPAPARKRWSRRPRTRSAPCARRSARPAGWHCASRPPPPPARQQLGAAFHVQQQGRGHDLAGVGIAGWSNGSRRCRAVPARPAWRPARSR